MHCSNCGADIPYHGRVCPYCNADKTEDKFSVITTRYGVIPGGILGLVITAPIPWLIIPGMLFGMFLGVSAITLLREFLRKK